MDLSSVLKKGLICLPECLLRCNKESSIERDSPVTGAGGLDAGTARVRCWGAPFGQC